MLRYHAQSTKPPELQFRALLVDGVQEVHFERVRWVRASTEAGRECPVSVFRDNPHRVNYARNIAEDRQKNINPEVLANPYLQEHSQRWEEDRDYDT